jgi:hypothetical protein
MRPTGVRRKDCKSGVESVSSRSFLKTITCLPNGNYVQQRPWTRSIYGPRSRGLGVDVDAVVVGRLEELVGSGANETSSTPHAGRNTATTHHRM